MNANSVVQIQTRYIGVSMDYHIELFDALNSLSLVRKVETHSPFQFMIPAFREGRRLQASEDYIQGSFVGYNYGSLIKCSVIAIKDASNQNPQTECNV
jgi:hypothetical protein